MRNLSSGLFPPLLPCILLNIHNLVERLSKLLYRVLGFIFCTELKWEDCGQIWVISKDIKKSVKPISFSKM